MLLAAIDEHHRGTYDFIYLPIDFKVSNIDCYLVGLINLIENFFFLCRINVMWAMLLST